MLAKADSDQITLLNLTAADKKLAELSNYKSLLQNFITQEVRDLSLFSTFSCCFEAQELHSSPLLKKGLNWRPC